MFKRTCKLCGESFTAKTDRKVYCSARCKDRGKPSANWQGRENAPNGGHGVSGYRRGCRCAECKAGQTASLREYNRSRKARDGVSYAAQRRRKARGVDPLVEVLCSVCGDALSVVRSDGGSQSMHAACRDSSSFYVPRSVRQSIHERDGWACQICFHPTEPESHYLSDWYPTLDHVIPQSLSLIEDHSPDALRTACRYCNLARGNRPVEDDHVTRERALARRQEVSYGGQEAAAPCAA